MCFSYCAIFIAFWHFDEILLEDLPFNLEAHFEVECCQAYFQRTEGIHCSKTEHITVCHVDRTAKHVSQIFLLLTGYVLSLCGQDTHRFWPIALEVRIVSTAIRVEDFEGHLLGEYLVQEVLAQVILARVQLQAIRCVDDANPIIVFLFVEIDLTQM